MDELTDIVGAFFASSERFSLTPLGSGNINDTYRLAGDDRAYVLQRINSKVFPWPEKVALNSRRVTKFLQRNNKGCHVPAIVNTRKGYPYHRDNEGHVWRVQEFVDNAVVHQRVTEPVMAYEVGRCLAAFHQQLVDLDPASLEEVLPGFHDLSGYLERFDAAVAEGRRSLPSSFDPWVEFIEQYRTDTNLLGQARDSGELRVSVIHGDPKISNFLFDRTTKEAITLIDLDTVGPGIRLIDIGDCLRSCASLGGEEDMATAAFDTRYVEALLKGYCSVIELQAIEQELIFEAYFLIAFELGIRFLTDYLQGDTYFKVKSKTQNLQRSQVLFNLATSLQSQQASLRRLIHQACR